MRILLVEDETDLAQSIALYLRKNEKIDCDHAHNLDRATELNELYEYDCFVVDIGLPDGSGLELIKRIKAKDSRAGIIIISASLFYLYRYVLIAINRVQKIRFNRIKKVLPSFSFLAILFLFIFISLWSIFPFEAMKRADYYTTIHNSEAYALDWVKF